MSGRNLALNWATPGQLRGPHVCLIQTNLTFCIPYKKPLVLNEGAFRNVSYTGGKWVAALEAVKIKCFQNSSSYTSMAQFWGPFRTSHNTASWKSQAAHHQEPLQKVRSNHKCLCPAALELVPSSENPKKNQTTAFFAPKLLQIVPCGPPKSALKLEIHQLWRCSDRKCLQALRVRESIAKPWDLP